jgi:hypothetical protein
MDMNEVRHFLLNKDLQCTFVRWVPGCAERAGDPPQSATITYLIATPCEFDHTIAAPSD